jgi:hypothetical protein
MTGHIMVDRVSSGGQAGIVAITAIRYAQDRQNIVMPVRPSQAIYANFTHIQVRPDSRLENGVPLYKLRILDTLIDQYSRKGPLTAAGPGKGPSLAVDQRSVDQLIGQIASELRPRVGGAPYRAGFLPEPGAFVDLVA